MAVKKISISLDSDVFERAKRAADADGVALSTWLGHAAEEAAGLAEARAALAEYIEVYGPPDQDAMTETRARMEKAGVGQWESVEETVARMAALAQLRGELPTEPRQRAG
ncbi:MAG: hypothetical protein ACRDRA_06810 [Pseudonocardiaceae bacterium]